MLGTKECYITVDYHELDNLINNEFSPPLKYGVAVDEETGNDTSLTYNVDGIVQDYDKNEITKFKETGRGMYLTRSLLNYLAAEGKIEKGQYLIKISW